MIYEVKAVHGEPREWSSKQGGTFLSYSVDFTDEDGVNELAVEWTKKPDSRPPSVGERVVGHIEPGKFSERFKIDYDATKELGRQPLPRSSESSTAGTSKPSAGETDWEVRNAEIRRQHSQQVAIEALTLVGETGSPLEIQQAIASWADFFDQDAIAAGQKASQGVGAGTGQGADPTPSSVPSTSAPPPERVSKVSVQEIEEALDTAGLTSAQARSAVSGWMMVNLPEERLVKAIANLTNPSAELQEPTLRALKENTEKHLGTHLPEGDDRSDDVPL